MKPPENWTYQYTAFRLLINELSLSAQSIDSSVTSTFKSGIQKSCSLDKVLAFFLDTFSSSNSIKVCHILDEGYFNIKKQHI